MIETEDGYGAREVVPCVGPSNIISRINQLTPCSTDFLEKLTSAQLVKELPAFYET
jgi:hypothetical protein